MPVPNGYELATPFMLCPSCCGSKGGPYSPCRKCSGYGYVDDDSYCPPNRNGWGAGTSPFADIKPQIVETSPGYFSLLVHGIVADKACNEVHVWRDFVHRSTKANPSSPPLFKAAEKIMRETRAFFGGLTMLTTITTENEIALYLEWNTMSRGIRLYISLSGLVTLSVLGDKLARTRAISQSWRYKEEIPPEVIDRLEAFRKQS